MAKKAAAAKAAPPNTRDQNTSAPQTADNQADVSASGAEQSAPEAATSLESNAMKSSEENILPPAGVGVLRVTAKRERFRRAGLVFGYLPRDVALADLTQEQIEQLKAEPMLSVEETTE